MNEKTYQEWLSENKSELIQTYAKECDIQENEVEDNYENDFDKYCKTWFKDSNNITQSKTNIKIFKCPNCKNVKMKDQNIIIVQCPCGEHMELVDKDHNPIDTRTESMKICDSHTCSNCPIRGTKCFSVGEI